MGGVWSAGSAGGGAIGSVSSRSSAWAGGLAAMGVGSAAGPAELIGASGMAQNSAPAHGRESPGKSSASPGSVGQRIDESEGFEPVSLFPERTPIILRSGVRLGTSRSANSRLHQWMKQPMATDSAPAAAKMRGNEPGYG